MFRSRPRQEDLELALVRESDNNNIILSIVRFFIREGGASQAYLQMTELAGGIPLYTKMKDELMDIGSKVQSRVQARTRSCMMLVIKAQRSLVARGHAWQEAATSRPGGAGSGFWIGEEEWQPEQWQEELKRQITDWEQELNRAAFQTFQPPFEQGSMDLKKALNDMKRAVNSRFNFVANVRSVTEHILKHLIRRLKNDPSFDPTKKVPGWEPKEDPASPPQASTWPTLVFSELKRERDRRKYDFRAPVLLDEQWYHLNVDAQHWLVKGMNNIDRLVGNLHHLRRSTDPVKDH